MPDENLDQEQKPAGSEVRDPDKLLQHYDRAKDELRAAKDQLKTLQTQLGDLKPEDITALKEFKTKKQQEETQAEEDRLKKEQQYEILLTQKVDAAKTEANLELDRLRKQVGILETERDQWKGKYEGFSTETNTKTLRSAAYDAFIKSGGKTGEGDLPADHYFEYFWATTGKRLKLDDKGNPQVLSPDGAAIATDAKGNALSLTDFMSSYKTKDDALFKFEVKGEGSGSLGSGTPGKASTPRTVAEENGIVNLRKAGVSLEDIISGKVKVRS
jgi:hypothetical protein